MKHSLEIMGFASLVILGVLIFCFLCLLVFSTLPNFKWYRQWKGGRWEFCIIDDWVLVAVDAKVRCV